MASVARWDRIAATYDSVTSDNLDPASAALLGLCGDVAGHRVLDVATGGGRMARALARRGAHVTAIDISAELLRRAVQREAQQGLRIRYLAADVSSPTCLPDEAYDGVAANFALSDIDDLPGALSTIGRVLASGGWFVFSILHPCFPGWPAADAPSSWPPGSGYFDERLWFADNSGFRRGAGANHRTLSTYINALPRNGLVVEAMSEPHAPPGWRSAAPTADEVPVFLVVRCQRR